MVERQPNPEIRKLYPHLSDEQLMIAEENLNRLIEHALRMFERIRNDPKESAGLMKLV